MTDSDAPVSVLVFGDYAPVGRAATLCEASQYDDLFGDLIPVIRGADVAIANLETPLLSEGTPSQKTGPNLKGSTRGADALAFAGINMVTLANNHIMDYGPPGLDSTLRACKDTGLNCVGAGSDLDAARRPIIHECRGRKLAIVNSTQNEWGAAQGGEPGVSPLNPVGLYYDIRNAATLADTVLVILHAGHEGYGLPSPEMKALFRYAVDIGADAVIAHHTHCFSGHETYRGKPIVYGLGNFVFDSFDECTSTTGWHTGCAVSISIEAQAINYSLVPFRQFPPDHVGLRLLDEREEAAFLDDAERKLALIQDDTKLNNAFSVFAQSRSRLYRAYLEPIRNRWLLAAMNRGWLPRFVRGKHQQYLATMIRCDTHREMVLEVIEE